MMSFIEDIKTSSRLELISRWILGATFLYGCYHKIMAPAEFAKIIYGYQLLPAASINLVAIILPFLELYCGIALILGIYPQSAAAIINTMLLGFILAISANLIRGVEFDCGCFSFGKAVHTHYAVQLLLRDILYFALGLQILFYPKTRKWCLLSGESLKTRQVK